jgi:predicted anti-sigma-YlaC factor YlaD
MPDHKHNKKFLERLHAQFGQDIDAEILVEIAKHMEDCPDCKIYVDSVKQTVKIYRTTEKEKSVPEDVSKRLFKTLKLKRYSP